MVTKVQISDFLQSGKMAIAGVSRDPKKFGNQVMHELLKREFEILPVTPFADKIDGIRCYPDVLSLPDDTENLLIVTPKSQTETIVSQAIQKGIKRLWIQQMSDTPEALSLAKGSDSDLIYGKCILMHATPVEGIHAFHRFFVRLFGQMPK